MNRDLFTQPFHADPAITAVNRAPEHAPWHAFSSHVQAQSGTASEWMLSLDGEYLFKLFDHPDQADDFFLPDCGDSDYLPIAVPGNWETQGFGQPLYTNVPYPWPLCADAPNAIDAGSCRVLPNPPLLPRDNPTGCYKKTFTVPESFLSRDVFLRFGGVETAYYLWINGRFVGYAEDSKLASDFLVTPYLHAGENKLALMVVRFATSSWLEDQDYWHLSGIHRSVCLIAKPKCRIVDYFVNAIPDLHGGGTLSVDVSVSRTQTYADSIVSAFLYDAEGNLVGSDSAHPSASAGWSASEVSGGVARICFPLSDVCCWTPETPYRYRLVLTLADAGGNDVDIEACYTGFKLVEIKDGVVYLNGRRLIIRGVNRHEHFPGGRAVPVSHMREEIRQMKRMHINSVRTSHYPNSPEWYELCDELGILVVCECNIETHGVMGALSKDAYMANAYLERAKRMLHNYKNHVCIYSWSLGNESGSGANHAAMYGYIKAYDPTRLCQYESGSPGKNMSDIRGQMYASIEYILEMLADPCDDRPIILVEYLYQISNSGGGAQHFRTLTERYPRFQGGYVWDWQDKCLFAKTESGEDFFGYGGAFLEPQHDHDVPPYMTNNGIVLPDLRWKPVAHELSCVYAPVWIEQYSDHNAWSTTFDPERFVLKNRSTSLSRDDLICEASIRENGRIIVTETVDLPRIVPGCEAQMSICIPHKKQPGCEYHMDIAIKYRTMPWYADADDLAFAAQFVLPSGPALRAQTPKPTMPVYVSDGGVITMSCGLTEVRIESQSGQLLSYSMNGKTLMEGCLPAFDRPRTGLDCAVGWGWHDQTSLWHGACAEVTGQDLLTSDCGAQVRFALSIQTSAALPVACVLSYFLDQDGLLIEYSAQISAMYEAVPRVGLRFALPGDMQNFRYLGYGPGECYVDRMSAAAFGDYESTVDQAHFPFIPPSEKGGHEGVRHLTLSNNDGRSLLIEGDAPFHFDARRNTVADYQNAKYEHELAQCESITLHIDAAHSPIGSNMAWSTGIDRREMLRGGHYHLRLRVHSDE